MTHYCEGCGETCHCGTGPDNPPCNATLCSNCQRQEDNAKEDDLMATLRDIVTCAGRGR